MKTIEQLENSWNRTENSILISMKYGKMKGSKNILLYLEILAFAKLETTKALVVDD